MCIKQASTITAGPPAFFSHRASDTQLLLARTGHKVFVRTTHCHIHIMLARTIIQRADLFPHCCDRFVRNATRLTHRLEFPCYVGNIQPLTVYPTIPLISDPATGAPGGNCRQALIIRLGAWLR